MEVRRRQKGPARVVGSDIKVANSTGDCAVVVHSTSSSVSDMSFHGADGLYQIVWEPGGNADVNLATFTVGAPDEGGVISIEESLPLDHTRIYTYSGPFEGRGILGIDLRDNQLVFGLSEQGEGTEFTSIILIDDVSDCGVSAQQSDVADTCTDVVFQATDRPALWPGLSSDGTRIYFAYVWPANDDPDFDYQLSVSYVDTAGTMSVPRAVVTTLDRDAGGFSISAPSATLTDLDGVFGEREHIAYSFKSFPFKTEIVIPDFSPGACDPLQGPVNPDEPTSCYSTGAAEIVRDNIDGAFPVWTSRIAGDEPLLGGNDLPPNLLVCCIVERDPANIISPGITLISDEEVSVYDSAD